MADPIFKIPQELIVRIASFLTTPELGPFRRSCRHIESYLFDAFAKEFFTKRQFMLEHPSLEALMGIASHPGLAARLEEVIIGTQALHIGLSPNAEWVTHGYLQRTALLESGLAFRLLSQAFAKLSNLRRVGLRDYDGTGRIRDGPHARWRSWGWSYSGKEESLSTYITSPEATFPLVLSALGQANAAPESIQVFLRRSALSPESFTLPSSPCGSETVPILSGLKSVYLTTAGEHKSSDALWKQYDDDNLIELPMRRFFHYLNGLSSLRLNFNEFDFLAPRFLDWLARPAPNSSPQSIGTSTSPVALPHLTTLELGMANVSVVTLIKLLSKWDLESISLWKLFLQAPGAMDQHDCWAQLLTALSVAFEGRHKLRYFMIGHAGQLELMLSDYRATNISFVPVGIDPSKKSAAKSFEQIVYYRAKYTNQAVTEWFKDMSTRTFVPDIHSEHAVSDLSQSEDDDDDDDDDDDENDDDEDDD